MLRCKFCTKPLLQKKPNPVKCQKIGDGDGVPKTIHIPDTSATAAPLNLTDRNNARFTREMKEKLQPMAVKCGHLFHKHCLKSFLEGAAKNA